MEIQEIGGSILMYRPIQVQEKSLAARVADQISELIRNRKLRTGDKLPNEFEIAQELGVGRGTVREAVKQLVAQNVLVIERGHGTFVAENPGYKEDPFGFMYVENQRKLANDLLEVRVEIEPWVAALAAQRATPEDIAAIQEKCEQAAQAILKDAPEAGAADVQFHVAIANATQNLAVPSLIPVINRSVDVFKTITKGSLRQETIELHQLITQAIQEHNPEAARRAMKKHLAANEKRMQEMLRSVADAACK